MTQHLDDTHRQAREHMVEEQLIKRGITDARLLDSMRRIERHLFLPQSLWAHAYEDRAIGLGPGKSISQPYIVAWMIQSLELLPTDRILEIGTGTGYQTAILSTLVKQVYSIEIDPELHFDAEKKLASLGYKNAMLKLGDGFAGWSEFAPYDAILVSAAPPEVPRELVRELGEGGRLILPLGEEDQELVLFKKEASGLTSKDLGAVTFVPMLSGSDEDDDEEDSGD